jgi:hypothetical protein
MGQRIGFLSVKTSISLVLRYGIEIDFDFRNRFKPAGRKFSALPEMQRQYYPNE